MQCPKCKFDHASQITECLRCGVVFARFSPTEPSAAAAPEPSAERAIDAEKLATAQARAQNEFICRIVALPVAFVLGRAIVAVFPALSHFLSMWLHESGHAVTAWFCGYFALPTAWVTLTGPRMRLISVVLFAATGFGGYVAFRRERWFWVTCAGIGVLLVLLGASLSNFQSLGLIYFGGDAGRFVLGSVLMLTLYARPRSKLRRHQARWGMLLIGAISFVEAYVQWSGGFERIAEWLEDIGENAAGPGDLFQLTQYFGWPIGAMQARFLDVARVCLVVLAGFYVWGIVDAMNRKRALAAGDAELIAEDAAAARPFDD